MAPETEGLSMKKDIVLALCAVLVLCASAGVAQAAGNPHDQGYSHPAAGGSEVAIVGCYSNGGSVTVPAGTPFTVYGGWGASSIGLVNDWLHGSTNTVSVDGGPAIDMTPYFAGLTSAWSPGQWADIFFYQVTTLAPGESVQVTWFSASNHPITDGTTRGTGAGSYTDTFICTVTGA